MKLLFSFYDHIIIFCFLFLFHQELREASPIQVEVPISSYNPRRGGGPPLHWGLLQWWLNCVQVSQSWIRIWSQRPTASDDDQCPSLHCTHLPCSLQAGWTCCSGGSYRGDRESPFIASVATTRARPASSQNFRITSQEWFVFPFPVEISLCRLVNSLSNSWISVSFAPFSSIFVRYTCSFLICGHPFSGFHGLCAFCGENFVYPHD